MKKTISHLLAILLGLILISATCSPEATTAYSISATPSTLTFPSMTVGYTTLPSAQTVTIKNNGMDAITLNPLPSPPTGYTFTAPLSTLNLAPGGTATFSIRPNAGLAVGSYNSTFKVTGSNGSNSVSVTISPTFTVGVFVAVTNITGVPTTAAVGSPLPLTGTVVPSTATNKTIKWILVNAGGTGATLVGNTLNNITTTGTITVEANITNGKAVGTHYVQTFTITAAYFSGSGTSGSPYLINNAADLNKLSELINLGNPTYAAAAVYYRLNSSFTMPAGDFTPIGTLAHPFQGSFDGNNKIITNLTVNTTTSLAGLFGYVVGGKISNLGLENVNINGGNDVGGVAGYIYNSASITGCYVTGKVSGSGSGGGAGGITAGVDNATVINCYTTCTVNGKYDVGGIAGYEQYSSIITLCYATGAISGELSVGGIVGYADAKLINNVALNPSIIQTGGAGTGFGRVAGNLDSSGDLTGNAAYKGMNVKGVTVSGGTADNKDGGDIGRDDVNQAIKWTAGGFVSPPWRVQNNRLPGLFGATVAIPGHITLP